MSIEETKKVEGQVEVTKKREIIIHTDGSNIYLVKSEASGLIELTAILQMLLDGIREMATKKPESTTPTQETPTVEPIKEEPKA